MVRLLVYPQLLYNFIIHSIQKTALLKEGCYSNPRSAYCTFKYNNPPYLTYYGVLKSNTLFNSVNLNLWLTQAYFMVWPAPIKILRVWTRFTDDMAWWHGHHQSNEWVKIQQPHSDFQTHSSCLGLASQARLFRNSHHCSLEHWNYP